MKPPLSTLLDLAASGALRWKQFVSNSPLRRLGESTLASASANAAARFAGFLKEIVVASAFGLADGVDVYLVAFVVIGFPLGLMLNAIQTALVAELAAHRGNVQVEAQLYGTTAAATLLVAVAALPLWFFALHFLLPLFASGFPATKLETLRWALFALLPYTVLNTINVLAYSVIQAHHRYFLRGILPSITPIATAIVVLVGARLGALEILILSLIVGTVAECIAVHAVLRSVGLRFRVDTSAAPFRLVVRASLLLLPGTVFMAIGPLVEQAIAASLERGTVSSLGYGNRIPTAISGVLVSAIGTTALPHFAVFLAKGDRAYCLHALRRLTVWFLGTGFVVGLVLALASEPIIRLFFERGAFDAASTARVAPVQQAYFLQLPVALVATLSARALAAAGGHHQISVVTVISIVLQIMLAWTLGIHFGAAGIAWAATIATAVAALAYYQLSIRRLRLSA